jgi:archaellum component FlaF (FlaF/FlaG flagellin family)
MEVRDIIYITLLVLGSSIPLVSYFTNIKSAKESIKKYLLSRGATEINISHDPFDADRDTLTFDVTYMGIKGNPQTTRCKVRHRGIYLDSQLFWPEPLSLELAQIEEDLPHSVRELPRSEYSEFSEKIRSHLSFPLPTYEISAVLPVPNSYDQIVMMKYTASFRNVFRCQADGKMVWQADLPTDSGDVYTNIEWKDKRLTAFSRSLMAVHLDVETGKILPTSRAQTENAA